MVILRTRNKITDFFMILAWASPFKQEFVAEFPASKCVYLFINRHLAKLNCLMSWESVTICFIIFSRFLFDFKLAFNKNEMN